MTRAMRRFMLFGFVLTPGCSAPVDATTQSGLDAPERIEFNDNLTPAGTLRRGELEITLEVRNGLWYLLGNDTEPGRVLAFAESGRAPQIPSPMIRVQEGTWIRAIVHNPTDAPLVVHGLSSRLQESLDTLVVPARGRAETRFLADVAGTYYYWATNSGAALNRRFFEDSQLGGALVVDPRGGSPLDRVLYIGIWVDGRLENGNPAFEWEYVVLNGRPWPHTERLTYELGDTIRWRVINASYDVHPMHLHGFHYRVDARGDLARDSVFWPAERRVGVTEQLLSGQTMTMAWSPSRPGGWLFHCHLSFHVVANAAIGAARASYEERVAEIVLGHGDHDPHNHVETGMGGLVLATRVVAPEHWKLDVPAARTLRLFVTSDSTPGAQRSFAYVLQEDDREPRADSLRLPGSTLVLRKGEPTAIRVFNRSPHPTQIHWHGLELESYYDGVVGIGGTPGMPTPAIMPGDSFEMRITPPRAGSFMYHTHMNDVYQQRNGLAGGIVVLEPDQEWDPASDFVFLVASPTAAAGDPRSSGVPLLNGRSTASPLELRVGTTYRFRMMNITLAAPFARVRLARNGAPELWVQQAKDGADLPQRLRVPTRADVQFTIGETMDFNYTPTAPGDVTLELLGGSYRLFATQPFRVFPAVDEE